MKKIITLIATLASTITFAQVQPVVESISTFTYIKADCPVCFGGQEVTETTITFSQEWCANSVTADDYELSIDEQSSMSGAITKLVKISLPGGPVVDCFGPTRRYNYKKITEELNANERYVLLNPSVIN